MGIPGFLEVLLPLSPTGIAWERDLGWGQPSRRAISTPIYDHLPGEQLAQT